MNKRIQSTEPGKATPLEQSREEYLLYLADNALILGQRNAGWCGHGPVLEQDIAITNISLDLIGQARNFYQYTAQLKNNLQATGFPDTTVTGKEPDLNEVTEDKLAYLRSEREFKNCLIVELPRGDWAQTILRQFFFSAYQLLLYTELQESNDGQIAAIAEKAVKEVAYHLRWSSEWVIRLGDGTEESNRRIQNAMIELWPYTGELFLPAVYETETAAGGIGIDPVLLKSRWEYKMDTVFTEATLTRPADKWMKTGGKQGTHTEHLGYILAEMQYMQRAYPGSNW